MSARITGTTRARSTAVRAALTATAVTGALLAVDAGAAHAASSNDFAQLRACESGGNYAINTGNGYYGAYQFDLSTWRSVGGSGYPHQAAPSTQDALAAKLQSQRGWSPWPACSRKLGLGSGSGSATASEPVRSAPERASRSVRRAAPTSYQGTLLTTKYVGDFRGDVKSLQSRLAGKGYGLAVDGYFGPQTRGAVLAFQEDAGIAVDGVVGPQTWGAAF